jgi:hypothetical protein
MVRVSFILLSIMVMTVLVQAEPIFVIENDSLDVAQVLLQDANEGPDQNGFRLRMPPSKEESINALASEPPDKEAGSGDDVAFPDGAGSAEEDSKEPKGPAGWRKRLERQLNVQDGFSSALPHVPGDLESYRKLGLAWYAKVGGYVHVDAIFDIGDHGDQFAFTPSAIPIPGSATGLENSGFVDLGTSARLNASRTRFFADLYTPVPRFLDGTRFYLEGDFYGRGGAPRLRHAFVAIPYLVIGRTNSAYKDADAEPETVDFNGPDATMGSRQQGLRVVVPFESYQLALAFEDTGGIITPGGRRVNEDFLQQRPDVSGHFRANEEWGHLQLSGTIRRLVTEDFGTGLESFTGYGVGLSGQVFTKDKDNLQFEVSYGDGIGSRVSGLAGTGSEVGLDRFGNLGTQRAFAAYVAYQHWWNESLRSTAYLSSVRVDVRDGQPADSFMRGTHAAINLIKDLNEHIKVGGEVIVGTRENLDGQSKTSSRVQAMFRYTF